MQKKERVAVFAGSFDPVTNGHLDIIKRASKIFDRLQICISINPDKKGMFTFEERANMINKSIGSIENVDVISFDGLLAKYCEDHDIDVLVRGVRSGADIEYELQMAYMNKTLNSKLETVILPTSTECSFISSSVIKQVISLGGDVKTLVPSIVLQELHKKIEGKKIKCTQI